MAKRNKIKRLCKFSKSEIETNLIEISRIISEPEFICTKCARSANISNVLCNPKAL